MTRLSVYVSDEVADAIRELAGRKEVSATEIVRLAVSAYKAISDEQAAGNAIYFGKGSTLNEVTFA
jgi:predicted transcriptional regulator